jgi:hypothetical protein
MALANVACILAGRKDITPDKGVLMIDWDLEAPGLHRYFCNRLEPRKRAADSLGTGSCDAEPGLIDLFYELSGKIDSFKDSGEASGPQMFSEDIARKVFDETDLDHYIIPTKLNGLSLLKAGRFNRDNTNEYPERVNKFNWEALYNKSPQLMRVFAEVLSEKYDYVLIDSRTGITDISGVCTMLLPEKLVVVFTPNMQSLAGAVDMVGRATYYRKESDDLRSLIVFPLVSRVESNEPELRYDWRFGNPDRSVTGYQAEFEKVLAKAYRKDAVDLTTYFDEMQIQHIPRYAYGEEIAALEERTEDKFSLKRSYKTFAYKLVERGLPWEELPSVIANHSAPSSLPPISADSHPAGKPISPLVYLAAGAFGVLALFAVILFFWSEFKPVSPGISIFQEFAANLNAATAEEPKLPDTFDRYYLGTIAGRNFRMNLKKTGNSLTGSASTDVKSEILLGTVEETGEFSLNAASGPQSPFTGIFSGRINEDGSITGKWTTQTGEHERPFTIQQLDPDFARALLGTWTGDWSAPSKAYLTASVTLMEDGEGGIAGQMKWTLRDTSRKEKLSKIGMSATEYVKGQFDPSSRTLHLVAYRKDDPDDVLIMLDTYYLTLSEDSHTLKGVTQNGGKWDGAISLSR